MTDNRLRVAMVSRASAALHGVGGLERHVDDLVRQLLECGVAVTLVTRPARRPADAVEADWLRDPGLTVRAIPYRTFPLAGRRGTTVLDRNTAYLWFGLRAGRCAARLVTEGQIDIVHGHGASVLGAVIAPPVRAVPLVFTPHGLEEFGGTDPSRAGLKRLAYRPLQAAVRRCARKASRIVATDRSLVSMTVRHLGVPPSRVRVLPNAVDVRRCDALAGPADGVRARSALNLADGEALILSVGRVERNKGFDLLAKALATLEERPGGSSWRWVLVGDGSTRSGLERLVTQLGLRHRVRFTGAVPDADLHAWYEAATLFVHPTLYEGSSIVTLEAMAHRCPVVATAAGGLPDKIKPGRNGWLVDPGDVDQLAQAISSALRRGKTLIDLGVESRAIVEQEFSLPAVVDRLIALYEEVRSESGRSRVC